MKRRNHKKFTWGFIPPKNSPLKYKGFKTKASLMKYLNANFMEVLNGGVSLHEEGFGYSHSLRNWTIWYNQNEYCRGAEPKIQLKVNLFRGMKYLCKYKISKEDKRWFAFSDKVYNLMSDIDQNGLTQAKAKNLVELFYKRGFVDFIPDKETQQYIDRNIKEGIPFYYWSDRCDGVRSKAIIEYFKQNNYI